MGYFDEEENKAQETSDDMSALAEGVMSKEEREAEKARLKEEKKREKELRQLEKMQKKVDKKKAKGLFVGDIEEKMNGLASDAGKSSEKTEEAAASAVDNTAEAVSDSVDAAADGTKEKAGEAASAIAEKTGEAASAIAEKTGEAASAIPEKTGEAASAIPEKAEEQGSEPESEEENGKKKRKKKNKGKDVKPEDVNIVRDLLSLIIYIGIVILVCFLIVTFVGRRTSVNGDSMNPTLESGDSVWVNMLGYKFSDPERYDIIVFPYEENVHYIKRIIGLPGETVQITKNGEILINGKVLQEPKQFDRMTSAGVASEPITLASDEYFVLGDNRTNSRDSRYPDVGNIKRDKIIGKAVFRLTPLKKFGKID